MENNNNKIKHLELIQGVINRLSTNSFSLKGWSVALISALFALSASDNRSEFVVLAYMPAIVFWILDGFYLWQEQLYRNLYNETTQINNANIDFKMDASSYTGEGKNKRTWIKAIFSKTLAPFYASMLIAIIIITILTIKKGG